MIAGLTPSEYITLRHVVNERIKFCQDKLTSETVQRLPNVLRHWTEEQREAESISRKLERVPFSGDMTSGKGE